MSRIHEALKKAEQERAATISVQEEPAAPAPTAMPIPAGSTKNAGDMPQVGLPSALATPPRTTEFFRFEDLAKRCTHPEWHLDPNVSVFANPDLSDHGAEKFRTLRSRLYQARGSQTLQTLLVTSSVPGEGKTFVTANLAQAIVRQPDKRALIIDADLRCARIHTVLGAPSSPGLSDYLRGDVDEAGVIQCGPGGNLCMIPGGSEVTNPSELLSNGRLKSLLTRMAPLFDWIVVDSPPCLAVADASILAGICDGVLLVVKAGSTPSAVAQRARQELQTQNVIGAVLNAVGPTHLYSDDYYQTYNQAYARSKSVSRD